MKFIGIIPARYASTRFPGKVLADIGGKPMIQLVYEQAALILSDVVVATDDDRIYKAVKNFQGEIVMTSAQHKSGTDRCVEALKIVEREWGKSYDIVINIQGDEPFIQPEQIRTLMKCFKEPDTEIATLIKPVQEPDVLNDPNRPKVIINKNQEAIYFSRSTIPYIRGREQDKWINSFQYYTHLGVYAYKKAILNIITNLPVSSLEKAESLEQLRWIDNGFKIKTAITVFDSICIDTPEDLENLKKTGL